MSKKLMSLIVVLLLVGSAGANSFTGAGSGDLFNTAANWSDGVPVMGTTNEWGDQNVDGTHMLIDDTHVGADIANPSGLYVGAYGATNTWDMTGGVLDTWYVNVARGDSDSGSDGYLNMTGGVMQNVQWFEIPNQWDYNTTPGEMITGVMDMSGGEVYTEHIALGTGEHSVGSGGSGTINLSGDAHFEVTVDGFQKFDDTRPAGSFNISGGARFVMAGNQVDLLNDMITSGTIVNTTGYPVAMGGGYTVIPEPATLILLGLGGLILRRRR